MYGREDAGRSRMIRRSAWLIVCAAALVAVMGRGPVWAQGSGNPPSPPPPPVVTVSARDADVRAVLADMFKQAKIANYTVANNVAGYVTLSLKDKPFDDALTLLCKAASPELSWSKTDSFYEVKLRRVRRVAEDETAPAPEVIAAYPAAVRYERIGMMYSDPRTILAALNALRPEEMTAAIAYLPTNALFVRYGGMTSSGGFMSGVIGDMFPGFPGGPGAPGMGLAGPGGNPGPGGSAGPGGAPGGTDLPGTAGNR